MSWRLAAVVAIATSAIFIDLIRYSTQYIFLFDDFALVGQAGQVDLRHIWTSPLFGFYRPLVFSVVKAEVLLFGWQHPAGYLLVGLAIHVGNALLVWRLASLVLRTPGAALVAAATFVASPWATEAFLWISGRFDLVATSCVLVALLGSLRWSAGATRGAGASMGLAVALLAFSAALAAKEHAVVLPGLVLTAGWLVRARTGEVAVGRLLLCCGVLGATALCFLMFRASVLPRFGGAYGDFWSLLARTSVPRNAAQFLQQFLVPPVAHDLVWRASHAVVGLRLLFFAFTAVMLWALAVRRRTEAWGILLALSVSVAPVIWVGMSQMSSAGGRVLYLPGVFWSLLIGAGVEAIDSMQPVGRRLWQWAAAAAAMLTMVHYGTSVHYQVGAWTKACQLSRDALRQFRPFVGKRGTLHVTNLPFWFLEGPYVLKSYAFRFYYAPEVVPDVTATAETLTLSGGVVTGVTREPEPGAPPMPPGEPSLGTLTLTPPR